MRREILDIAKKHFITVFGKTEDYLWIKIPTPTSQFNDTINSFIVGRDKPVFFADF